MPVFRRYPLIPLSNIGINQQFANVRDALSIESNKLQFDTVQNIIGMERTDNAVLLDLSKNIVYKLTDCTIINSNEIIGFNVVYVQNIQSTNREIIEKPLFTSHSVVEITLCKSNITNNDPSIKGDITIVSDAEINLSIITYNFNLYTFVTAFHFGDCDSYSVSYSDKYNNDDRLLCIVTKIDQTNFSKVYG